MEKEKITSKDAFESVLGWSFNSGHEAFHSECVLIPSHLCEFASGYQLKIASGIGI